MASSIIHLAVASEINKRINYDKDKLLLGSIAPDIAKLIGENKVKSHFLDSPETNIPNIDDFLEKYENKMNDAFVMGYFIHLYTDYLWFKYFLTEFYSEPMITKLDGNVVKCNGRMVSLYVYNDYTNLNKKLIDEYKLDLNTFYSEIPQIENIIEEIPIEKLDLIVNKCIEIIDKSKERKPYVFNMDNINKFIESSVDLIISKIDELKYYRISINNKGIYQALKERIFSLEENPKEIWNQLKTSEYFSWLSNPNIDYKNCISFFTKEGLCNYQKYASPLFMKYFDKDEIVITAYDSSNFTNNFVYRDSNQVVKRYNILTSCYDNIKCGFDYNFDYELVSITGDGGNAWNFYGKSYKKMAPSLKLWTYYDTNPDNLSENDLIYWYIENFLELRLNNLDPIDLLNILQTKFGDNIILLCHETPGLEINLEHFCHRRLLADWFKLKLNLDIDEVLVNEQGEVLHEDIYDLTDLISKSLVKDSLKR